MLYEIELSGSPELLKYLVCVLHSGDLDRYPVKSDLIYICFSSLCLFPEVVFDTLLQLVDCIRNLLGCGRISDNTVSDGNSAGKIKAELQVSVLADPC